MASTVIPSKMKKVNKADFFRRRKAMPVWKRNLFVCWIGVFIAAIGMSEVAPILPLYIRYLGIQNTALVSQLSGITFGSTYLITAIFSPIWGHAADKSGETDDPAGG